MTKFTYNAPTDNYDDEIDNYNDSVFSDDELDDNLDENGRDEEQRASNECPICGEQYDDNYKCSCDD